MNVEIPPVTRAEIDAEREAMGLLAELAVYMQAGLWARAERVNLELGIALDRLRRRDEWRGPPMPEDD